MNNELKQKANEFYARNIWNTPEPVRVYMDHRENLFTTDKGHLFIGKYTRDTEGADFFLDVIKRLREYTKDYAVKTSLQNVVMEE